MPHLGLAWVPLAAQWADCLEAAHLKLRAVVLVQPHNKVLPMSPLAWGLLLAHYLAPHQWVLADSKLQAEVF